MSTLYFAYGSNMNIRQMLGRCPKAQYVKKAILNGWELYINGRGVSSIRKKKDSKVVGVVWKITKLEERILDIYEGAGVGFYTKCFFRNNGEKILVYIDYHKGEGKPRPGYLERIIQGAEDFRLPQSYVEKLKTLA